MEWSTEEPWKGISVDVTPELSPAELAYKAKLDFELIKVTSGMPKSFANQEMFQFIKNFTRYGGAPLKMIGAMAAGRIVWSLADLNEEFTIKGDDILKAYLMLSSRNEMRDNVDVSYLVTRPLGFSTFQVKAKGRTFFRNVCRRSFISEFPFMTPKSEKFEDNMIKRTEDSIERGRTGIANFAAEAQKLAEIKVDEQTANRFMFDVFQPGVANKLKSIGENEIKDLAEKKTKSAIEAFQNAPNQDQESTNMTAWGLLTAASYTIDHLIGSNQESRLKVAWFGPTAKTKKLALELALKL
jgi:hypothetical protein